MLDPQSSLVPGREVKVDAGEGGPDVIGEVLGIEVERQCPAVEARVERDLGDVKARGEPPVDQSDDSGPTLVEIAVKDKMGLCKLTGESSLFISCCVGFLKADDVGCLINGSNMLEYFVMSDVGARLTRVVGNGVYIVEDHPWVRDGGVEGAGGPVDTVSTHLIVRSGLFVSSGLSSSSLST